MEHKLDSLKFGVPPETAWRATGWQPLVYQTTVHQAVSHKKRFLLFAHYNVLPSEVLPLPGKPLDLRLGSPDVDSDLVEDEDDGGEDKDVERILPDLLGGPGDQVAGAAAADVDGGRVVAHGHRIWTMLMS